MRTADGRRGFIQETTEDPSRRLVRTQGSRRLPELSATLKKRARPEQGIIAVPTRFLMTKMNVPGINSSPFAYDRKRVFLK
ncbi:hypothetical protein NDU88_002123 [Pleurodeles waltl]|uniref:Uncharacterized protein n=1 Tax=Pleurodeles waltl TaxID=8319 RepID=A0AAV7VYS5_PLEWA|nr:hypothetical protein NDU88_002123 [Pleurodeles waltl]